jgi:osmoprotectant transport system ATP-binding protein
MITLSRLSKSYDHGRTFAVREVNLQVAPGELLVLLGESGCGKTTTLKMINRLIEPTSGEVVINGKESSSIDPVLLRRSIGYVFQSIGLFPHMTVAENIRIVPRLLCWDTGRINTRTDELLELVGLDSQLLGQRFPIELSGGQQQRVGVARALAARPKVLLMDEPFGALDPITRSSLQEEFHHLSRSLGITVVMVTHDMTEALLLSDRIAIMQMGEIVRIGTPRELLRHPDHPYVATLMAMPKRQADRVEEIAGEGNGDE